MTDPTGDTDRFPGDDAGDGARAPDAARAARRRRWARDLAILAVIFAAGFGATFVALAPGPIFAGDAALQRLIDLTEADATAQLARANLRARRAGSRSHPTVPAGIVIWQEPAPGTRVPPSTAVQLWTSDGPATIAVPDVVDFPPALAARVIIAAGLTVGRQDTLLVRGGLGARVSAVRPAAGTPRPPGSAVDLDLEIGVPSEP